MYIYIYVCIYVYVYIYMYTYICIYICNSCDVFVCVTWLICMCNMTHLYVQYGSFVCATCEISLQIRMIAHIRMSRVTVTSKESCHSHIRMSHVTVICMCKMRMSAYTNESWVFRMCHVTHPNGWHNSASCFTGFVQMCSMTPLHVWHDSFGCFTWRFHLFYMSHWYVWHDSFIPVTWLIHTCGMARWYVWHDSFICKTWLIGMCDVTHWSVWHHSFTCETWLIDTIGMARGFVWHNSFVRMTRSFMCVTWCIRMCDTLIHVCNMMHSDVWHAHSCV